MQGHYTVSQLLIARAYLLAGGLRIYVLVLAHKLNAVWLIKGSVLIVIKGASLVCKARNRADCHFVTLFSVILRNQYLLSLSWLYLECSWSLIANL